MEDVARGLSVAHAAGVTHRDLKPSNIFLTPNGQDTMAKIVDFGIARTTSSQLTASGEMVGTPRYMSPEQVLEEGGVDARSDLWSLALVVYECLLGCSPHGQKSTARIIRDLGTGPLRAPSEDGAPWPGFDAWFAKATSSDPDARFRSAAELVESLRPVLNESAVVPESGFRSTGQASAHTTVATVLKARGEAPASDRPRTAGAGVRRFVAVAVLGTLAVSAYFFLNRPPRSDQLESATETSTLESTGSQPAAVLETSVPSAVEASVVSPDVADVANRPPVERPQESKRLPKEKSLSPAPMVKNSQSPRKTPAPASPAPDQDKKVKPKGNSFDDASVWGVRK